MGKGIAKEFKTREPKMFVAYKKLCDDKLLSPGKLWLWRGTEFWTLNFPTKMHWRNPSRIEWIDSGLKKFVAGYEKLGIREISFPRLGCGNGGLDWDEVKPLMESYLRELPIEVYIHDFTVDVGLPEHLQAIASKLRTEQTEDPTFAAFVEDIRKAVSLAGSELLDLTSERPFSASMNADVLEPIREEFDSDESVVIH